MILLLLLYFPFSNLQHSYALFSPVDLHPTGVTPTSISISWRTVGSEAKTFLASLSPLNENEIIRPKIKRANETRATWQGLVPGKNYTISVTARDQYNRNSLPRSISVTTVPMPPYHIRISKFVNPVLSEYEVNRNQTMMFPVYGAVVMWDGPDLGHFDGFHVQISPPDGIVRLPITLQEGETIAQETKKQRIVWDLIPGIYYRFTVRTKSLNRMSDPATASARMPPEIPGPIKVVSILSTTATLSWNSPHRGILDGYVIEIDPPDGQVVDAANPETKWRRIEKLTPGMRYQVDVYSTSFGILSFQSRKTNITTHPGSPQGPISASGITNTSITLRWKNPVGHFDYFEVIYFPKSHDIGRLRHRVYDPAARLSFLTPSTEYSIIVYAVSNKLYSKPLFASVFTKPFLTTQSPKIYPTTSESVFVIKPEASTKAKDDEFHKEGPTKSITDEEPTMQILTATTGYQITQKLENITTSADNHSNVSLLSASAATQPTQAPTSAMENTSFIPAPASASSFLLDVSSSNPSSVAEIPTSFSMEPMLLEENSHTSDWLSGSVQTSNQTQPTDELISITKPTTKYNKVNYTGVRDPFFIASHLSSAATQSTSQAMQSTFSPVQHQPSTISGISVSEGNAVHSLGKNHSSLLDLAVTTVTESTVNEYSTTSLSKSKTYSTEILNTSNTFPYVTGTSSTQYPSESQRNVTSNISTLGKVSSHVATSTPISSASDYTSNTVEPDKHTFPSSTSSVDSLAPSGGSDSKSTHFTDTATFVGGIPITGFTSSEKEISNTTLVFSTSKTAVAGERSVTSHTESYVTESKVSDVTPFSLATSNLSSTSFDNSFLSNIDLIGSENETNHTQGAVGNGNVVTTAEADAGVHVRLIGDVVGTGFSVNPPTLSSFTDIVKATPSPITVGRENITLKESGTGTSAFGTLMSPTRSYLSSAGTAPTEQSGAIANATQSLENTSAQVSDEPSPGSISSSSTFTPPPEPSTTSGSVDRSTNGPGGDNGGNANGGSVFVVQMNGKLIRIKNGFTTICKPDNITVLVDKTVIGQYENNYGPLHLNDGKATGCRGVEYPNYYRYTIAPNILDCGTTIEVNETHVNFSNSVSNTQQRKQWMRSMTDFSGAVLLGNRINHPPIKFVELRLWCTFSLDLNVTSIYPFLPQLTLQVLSFNVSGYGAFSAVMRIFKNSSYLQPYIFPPTFNESDTLYVGISLLDSSDNATNMVVERCWGTPERYPNHSRSYPIISESCPVKESLDGSVQVFENGQGKRVRWQGNVFKFISYTEVWLHCEIRICFGVNCKPDCESANRRKRSLESMRGDLSKHVLSTGPIVMTSQPPFQSTPESPRDVVTPEGPTEPFPPDIAILIIVIILCVIIILSCLIILCIFGRLRRDEYRRRKALFKSSMSFPSLQTRNLPVVSSGDDDTTLFGIPQTPANSSSYVVPEITVGIGEIPISTSPRDLTTMERSDGSQDLGSINETVDSGCVSAETRFSFRLATPSDTSINTQNSSCVSSVNAPSVE